MAVFDKLRRINNAVQAVEAGPGCVGIWVDSTGRLRFKDDRGNVYTVYDPSGETSGTFGSTVRLKGTFDTDDTLSLTVERSVSVTVADSTITFTSGAITAADVGRPISWNGFTGVISSLDSATTATVFTITGDLGSGAQTATVGENFDDALYEVVSIQGDDAEVFTFGSLAASGLDIYSSNPTSTATVVVTLVR